MFNWQHALLFFNLLFFNLLIVNPVLTIATEALDTPEKNSTASPSPTLRPATPPAVSPVSSIRYTPTSSADSSPEKTSLTTRDLAAIDWDIILLNTPDGLLEREKFANNYKLASQANNSQFLAELITQVYRQIEWTVSAAAGADRLTPAEISTAVCQLQHICSDGINYYHNCCDEVLDFHDKGRAYTADQWQEIPIPCAKHFDSYELEQIVSLLILSAFAYQKTHDLAQLNPKTVSRRIVSFCDNPVFRFLRVYTLAQKLVTPDNITWLQRKILIKLYDQDAAESTTTASEEVDEDCLSHTEWTLLLA